MSSKIEVIEDPRYPGEYIAIEGDLFYWIATDADGKPILVNDDVTPIPPDVSDAIKSHLDPSYVAPDYHAISRVI